MDTTHTAGEEWELHEQLVAYSRAWARHNIYFGFSSTRRRLEEHARIFSTACVDVYPQTPAPTFRSGASLPREFRLGIALMSKSLVYRFPHRHPISMQRGTVNERFLDPDMFREELCAPQLSTMPHGGIVILPIEQIYNTEGISSTLFLERLRGFLRALPVNYRYAVELHNREYLLPGYLDMLRTRHVAHVLVACAEMPDLLEQIQLPRVLTTNVAVVRAMHPMDTELQLGIMETIRRCVEERVTLYIYLDGGSEACSTHHAIARLMESLNPDLAKLSPIKNLAA